MELVLPVECEIPSLKLAIELLPDTTPLEECLVHLEQLDEQRRDALVAKAYFCILLYRFSFHS